MGKLMKTVYCKAIKRWKISYVFSQRATVSSCSREDSLTPSSQYNLFSNQNILHMNDKAVFGSLKSPRVCVLLCLVKIVVVMSQKNKRRAQKKPHFCVDFAVLSCSLKNLADIGPWHTYFCMLLRFIAVFLLQVS